MTVDAVANRDTPVLMAVVVLAAAVYVIINLLVDLLYPVLDARLRTGEDRPEDRQEREEGAGMKTLTRIRPGVWIAGSSSCSPWPGPWCPACSPPVTPPSPAPPSRCSPVG